MEKIKTSTPYRTTTRRLMVWTVEKVAPKTETSVVNLKPVPRPSFGRSRETQDGQTSFRRAA